MEVSGRINRRAIQALWAAALLVFVVAAFHMSPPAQEWTGDKVTSIVSSLQGDRAEWLARFKERSEAIWAKTVRDRHEMIARDYKDVSEMPKFPATDPDMYHDHPYTVWDFMPASFSCPWHVERVGRMGDGGKWVCGMSRYEQYPADRECVIYSFGVRDESSFEQEMLKRTSCVVWAFDFSVVDFGEQVDARYRDRAHFRQVGIAGKTDTSQTPPFYSIADLMRMNGHTYIDVLKMDIETAEFEAMDGLSDDFPAGSGAELPIGQLLVEIHVFEETSAKNLLDWWERLEARGLRAAWTEPNLLAVTMNSRGKDPVMAEYSMVNVRDGRSVLFK